MDEKQPTIGDCITQFLHFVVLSCSAKGLAIRSLRKAYKKENKSLAEAGQATVDFPTWAKREIDVYQKKTDDALSIPASVNMTKDLTVNLFGPDMNPNVLVGVRCILSVATNTNTMLKQAANKLTDTKDVTSCITSFVTAYNKQEAVKAVA